MTRTQIVQELTQLFRNAPFHWAICGGYGLDIFLEQDTRTHGDIDLCVLEPDRAAAIGHMLSLGWQVYEFRGQGKVRPIHSPSASDNGRNILCLKEGCDLIRFYPSEEEGLFYHEFFHTGLKELNYLEFLFSTTNDGYLLIGQQPGLQRELSKAFLTRDGVTYLAPEIALLYKAANADQPEYQLDFQTAYPRLSPEQQGWFGDAMNPCYPDGHPWLQTQA